MEKNQFVIHLGEDTPVDLALLTDKDWKRIKADAKFMLVHGHAKDPAQAYLAAFVCLLKDIELLSEPYNCNKHCFI